MGVSHPRLNAISDTVRRCALPRYVAIGKELEFERDQIDGAKGHQGWLVDVVLTLHMLV